MISRVVSKDYLAPLLLLDYNLEPKPLPFRGQSAVQFIIPIEEYIKFCAEELGTKNYLNSSSIYLKELAINYQSTGSLETYFNLFKNYLKDISTSILKEIYYAEIMGKGSTVITYSVKDTDIFEKVNLQQMYKALSLNYEETVMKRLLQGGYTLENISELNIQEYRRAIVLYGLSEVPSSWSNKLKNIYNEEGYTKWK